MEPAIPTRGPALDGDPLSAKAVGWVFENSPYRGHAFVIHLAIADVVNDLHHNEFWMHNANLAAKARCSGTTVRETQRKMLDAGYLIRIGGETGGRGREAGFRFIFLGTQQIPVAFSGPGPGLNPPETRRNRPVNPPESAAYKDNVLNANRRARDADPECMLCHGSGVQLSPSPGPDKEPFNIFCSCRAPDYEPRPAPSRPPDGFGMPGRRETA